MCGVINVCLTIYESYRKIKMKRTLEEIENYYKKGSLNWDHGQVFQAVSDIAGLIIMVKELKSKLEERKDHEKVGS